MAWVLVGSGQFQALAALPPVWYSPVPTEKEAGWVPDRYGRLENEEFCLPHRESNQGCFIVQVLVCHHTDCFVPVPGLPAWEGVFFLLPFYNFENDCGAHPTSHRIKTGPSSPGAKNGRGVNLTTHFHLVFRVSIRGTIPSLLPISS